MDVNEITIMIGSEDPERLAAFYELALQLPRVPSHDFVFQAGPARIRIIRHSTVHGRNPEPARMQLNLFVTGVRDRVERLRGTGVPVIREPSREGWGGIVATLEDPDGNYLQLLEPPTG